MHPELLEATVQRCRDHQAAGDCSGPLDLPTERLVDAIVQLADARPKPYVPRPEPLTLEEQFAKLQKKFPSATIESREFENDGHKWNDHLVTIKDWPLPPGYNRSTCTVYFVVPAGYPYVPPDRFYTDALTLANGGQPYYARPLYLGGRPDVHPEKMKSFPAPHGTMLWFWKISDWKWNRDTLWSYALVIRARLDNVHAG